MNLTFSQLKKILPELNINVVTPARMLQVFAKKGIEFYELCLEDAGCYVTKDGRDYVFLRHGLQQLLFQEMIIHEGVHALVHYPATFLMRRHQLEAETFSLIGMMPLSDLPRLNRIKDHLNEESFELLKRRNKVFEIWKI